MKCRVQKNGYKPLVIMIALPLLALGLRSAGWASLASPGVTNFVEAGDGNVQFNGIPGSSFDWANGTGTSAPLLCTYPTPGTSGTASCPGTGGLFDGGVFNSSTTDPSPPAFIAGGNTTIVAHAFGVDELGLNSSVAKACSLSASPCASNADCPAGETCVTCGTGDATVYTGVGSETNGDPLSGETYATATVPNKDDISNVYAISHQDPPSPPTAMSTDTNELFAGFERVINNGDSHVDLEFLQAPLGLVPGIKPADFPCAGNLDGHRSAGDLLIAADFTKGGGLPTLNLYKWSCNGTSGVCVGGSHNGGTCMVAGDCPGQGRCECDPDGTKSITPKYVGPAAVKVCSGTSVGTTPIPCTSNADCPATQTCNSITTQSVNSSTTSCGGWACRTPNGDEAFYCLGGTKDGTACTSNAQCPKGTCTSAMLKNEFYEVGLDLNAAGFTGCINTFLPHTRSSQSFTAVLKDFTLLSFQTCRPGITVTKNCTAAVTTTGDQVRVDISGQVCNTGQVELSNIGLTNSASGTTFDQTGCLAPGTTLPRPQSGSTSCCSYTGHYFEADDCAPADTVTVTATSSGGLGTVTASDNAFCEATVARQLNVTKSCTADLNASNNGVKVTFTGTVSNPVGTGELKLALNTLTDVPSATFDSACSQGTNCCTPGTTQLAPGDSCNYSGSYAGSCSNMDTVTATATSVICPDTVSGQHDASCGFTPQAALSVTKCCSNHLVLSSGKLFDQVDFQGTVTSTGSDNSVVSNVVVTDSVGQTHNVGNLTHGQSANYIGTPYFPTDPNSCTASDTASASGTDICGNTVSSNTATAMCSLCGGTTTPAYPCINP